MNASAAALAPSGPPPNHPEARIVISVGQDNVLRVDGPIDSKAWCVMHLNAAIKALNPFHVARADDHPGYLPKRAGLRDVEAARIVVSVFDDDGLGIEGPLGSREWVIACLENAIDAVRAYRRPGSVVVDKISDPRLAS